MPSGRLGSHRALLRCSGPLPAHRRRARSGWSARGWCPSGRPSWRALTGPTSTPAGGGRGLAGCADSTPRHLGRYPQAKRQTLMLAFLSVRAEEVTDAIVEMFDVLVGRVFSRADDELTDVKA